MSPEKSSDWNTWSQYVLKELESINKREEQFYKSLLELHVEVAQIKVKSGIWGAVAGLIPVLVALLISFLTKR